MSSFRFARSALRARPSMFSAPIQRRGYAEAVADKIKLSLTLPHQVRQTHPVGPPSSWILGLTCILSDRPSTARPACMFLKHLRPPAPLPGMP